ncbi:FtsX-like permease family protein [Bacteroidales bacterium OttesenSCG-928-B11]|nr:FtsX-like permease family protein [Bacteroidales bacterium OttesenSCG-928-E04]MDL2308224.1 FtsX-like permease family protein [Bacteroidales bacterium OttesenSCG-928-C03]MDL2311524.1 FtsX-like permease family protein [Bacteroidales bacterium OttesenSCG-928-B11]MDL2325663.1 FtsX-like permease family protein [Bacteroidales bacterium OttesenSCG-928-A14]
MAHKTNLHASFFIAWRYLFSKKKHNIVNIISIISTVGIAVSAAALIVVLSVFNGIEGVITDSFNSFNPDLRITPTRGKEIAVDSFPFQKIKNLNHVASIHEIVSDLALVTYKEQQVLARIKGVNSQYVEERNMEELLIDGDFALAGGGMNFGVCGAGMAAFLQLYLDEIEPLKVYYPKRTKKNLANAVDAFYERNLIPGGVFATFTNYDDEYLFCNIEFARTLMDYHGLCTSVELFVSKENKLESVRETVQDILGDNYIVQDKFQQEELLFKTMKSEKMMIFLILVFVLVIAAFNIISTMGMLIIEKKDDLRILASLGANRRFISRIFILEGLVISFLGGLAGMLFGALICFIQDTFHLISYGNAEGFYIIDHYPVDLQGGDFLIVLITILIISLLASYFPVKIIKKRYTK